MHLSPVDAFLAVATLSTAILAEILVFVVLGLILEVSQWWNNLEIPRRV